MSASPKNVSVSPEVFYLEVSRKADEISTLKESLQQKQEKLEQLEKEMQAFNEKANLNETQEAEKRAAEKKLEERKKQVAEKLQAERAIAEKEALAVSVTMVNESKPEPKPSPESDEDEIDITENKENEENKEKKSKDTSLEETEDENGNKILNRLDAEGKVVSSAHFVKNENGGVTVHINASTEEGRLQSMKDGLKAMSEQSPNCSVGFKNFSDQNTYEGMKEAMNLNMAPHIEGKRLMESAEFFSEQAEKENPGTSRQVTQQYLQKAAGHDKLKERLIEEMVDKGLGSKEDLEKLSPEKLAEKAVDQVMLDVEAKNKGPALVSSDEAQPEPAPAASKKEDEVKTESKSEPAKVAETTAASTSDKPAASPTPSGTPPSPSPFGETVAKAVGAEAKAGFDAGNGAGLGISLQTDKEAETPQTFGR